MKYELMKRINLIFQQYWAKNMYFILYLFWPWVVTLMNNKWKTKFVTYFRAKKTFPKAPRLIGFNISKSLIDGGQWEFITGFFMKESASGVDIVGLGIDSVAVVEPICDAILKIHCDESKDWIQRLRNTFQTIFTRKVELE